MQHRAIGYVQPSSAEIALPNLVEIEPAAYIYP